MPRRILEKDLARKKVKGNLSPLPKKKTARKKEVAPTPQPAKEIVRVIEKPGKDNSAAIEKLANSVTESVSTATRTMAGVTEKVAGIMEHMANKPEPTRQRPAIPPPDNSAAIESLAKSVESATSEAAASARDSAMAAAKVGESVERLIASRPKSWKCTVNRDNRGLIDQVDIEGVG